jgi:DNA polymerase elongation subunit (family B)
MELQILDCDYTLVNNKPIVRLFCKDIQGESICVFYDKFLPYFYLYGDESKYQEVIDQIKNKYPNLKIEIVEKSLPIGYQPPVKVLKIIGNNPGDTPEIREFVKRFGTPYEADVLFRYRFMADFDLKGMGWINVEGKFTKTNTVKCKAFVAESIKPIEILKNAPLKFMSLDIECLAEEDRIAVPEKDKIIVISLVFSPEHKGKKNLVIVAKSVKTNNGVISCKDEKEMLEKFKDILHDYDPDIICGHNINGFDLPFLIKRLEVLNISRDLGRSEKSASARKLQHSYIPNVCGRVVVDSFEIFKRDPWVKFKRYDLSTISKEVLGEEKVDLGGDYLKKVREMWNGTGFEKFVDYAKKDAELALRLVVERHLLDKFFEVAKACGLLLQDCLGGQSQRHEFRLLKEFNKKNFIVPCKPVDVSEISKEHGLKGALVLEPDTGLHEWVIALDFTSMYPSLIKAFNICTTTFLTNGENIDCTISPYGTKFVKSNVFKGIIPTVVEDLLNARVIVKKQLKMEKDPENKRILQAKQLALKDLSNSVHSSTDIVVKDPAGKMIVTEIGKLFDSLSKNNSIRRINDGIEAIELSGWHALSVDGDKSCFKPLYAISRHKNNSKLIKVRTKMGEVKITPSHSIIEMKGKANNRIRESRFSELSEIKGSDVNYNTIIAQVNNVQIDDSPVKYLNILDILLNLPDNEISDVSLFVPQSLNLNKHNWIKNRARIFNYLKDAPASLKLMQKTLGFDRRAFKNSVSDGLKIIGNLGQSPVYDLTEEGEEYLSFYEAFKDAKETPDHYEISLTKLRGIKIPNKILTASKIAVRGDGRRKMNILIPITTELAEIFGWYVSEGSIYKKERSNGTSYKAGIENYNTDVLNRLINLSKNVFNYKLGLYENCVSFNLKIFYLIFKYLCGNDAFTKKVPDFILNSSKEIRTAFLDAYTKGDGDKDGGRLSTRSKELAAQISFMLKEQNCILHNGKDSGMFRISKRSFVVGRKIVSGDLFGQPPVEINEAEQTDYVYDLSVRDTEKFVTAQGLVLHNSLYGYTGYSRSRLYVMDIANTITAYGRDTITKTKKLIEENFPVKVIYADTDSVFIKSNVKDLDEAEEFGKKISGFVSGKLYGLDLKFEKTFKTFLIEAKKRYAGWTFERDDDKWVDKMEMKGIETVRRDWCSLTSETMLNVLNIILKEKDINKASKYVRSMVDDLAKGKIPLEKLSIIKGITKALDSYDGVQPHVELAKKIARRDKTRSLVGERLEYVIVKGNQLMSKRAEDPKFVKEKGLEIDSEYYIYNQLLPPLERIFEACGISSSELLEGVKQKSLLDMLNGQKKQLSPEETVLKTFESVVCKNCGWEFRRPSLNGNCPKCSGQLYFASSGSMGKTVDLTK